MLSSRKVLRRLVVAAVAVAGFTGSSAVPAFAANTSFSPPPGCTGSWNTAQSAANNHAPGTSPGCTVAESHAH
jgi:hypothetical protein